MPLAFAEDVLGEWTSKVQNERQSRKTSTNEHGFKRNVRRHLVLGRVFAGFGRVVLAIHVTTTGTRDPFMWGVLVFNCCVLVFALTVSSRLDCLLIPGGIIFRKAKWYERTRQIKLYQPTSSVLCVFRFGGEHWGFVVADREGFDHSSCTAAEVNVLLGCWISELSPPRLEQLSDLH